MMKYLKMKKKEIKLKLTFYTMLEYIIHEKSDMFILIDKLYVSLKDVPQDEIRDELLSKLAEYIHRDQVNTND